MSDTDILSTDSPSDVGVGPHYNGGPIILAKPEAKWLVQGLPFCLFLFVQGFVYGCHVALVYW